VVVAVIFVGMVKPALDQVVGVIAVRNGLVSAVIPVGVRRIAADGVGVVAWMGLVDRDHVFVDVLVVGMVQVAVVEVVDVIVVTDGGMAAARSVLVRMGAFMDLVGHAPDLTAPRLVRQGLVHRVVKYVDMPIDKQRRRRGARGPREERGVTIAQIQAAARASFAQNGWAGTSLRAIAREVGVDPALIHYYFSSKEELLDAVTTPPAEWLASIEKTSSAPLAERGEAMVRNVAWAWSKPDIREVLESILVTAAHESRTRERLRAFIAASLLPAVADRVEGEERQLRATLIGSQVLGLVMLRYVWQIEPLASLPVEELVALVAPTLQRYLSGRLG
jgi:AcrR family transcriptional regulator